MFALKTKPVTDNNVPWHTVDLDSRQSEMSCALARLEIGPDTQAAVFNGDRIVEGPITGQLEAEVQAEADRAAAVEEDNWLADEAEERNVEDEADAQEPSHERYA